ncbi:signal peptidase I [Paenibacillus sp. MWE-103]|uniref:Signal peptidase I n=1 Tax=Paenibacillus artemisiicola TaxID=1172618 RepID=A0ABS3W7U7_9BACL|nr:MULTISPECIES: signal peptidase I [Paenibacillus]MBO7744205.1 signal peptidase I [Paenibacillus artemisiicola]SFI53764.1 signal peptidase I [Paenibacillus sp. UNC496MF]
MDQQHRNDEQQVEQESVKPEEHRDVVDGTDAPDSPNKPPVKGKAQKELFEWVKALAIAAILVLVIRYFLFAPFIVDGPSMEPNFYTGERLIVDKAIFELRKPKRGEVIVFHVPEEGRDFIKRVIGVPGDKIKYEDDNLYVNGKLVDEPYLKESIAAAKAKGEIFNNNGGEERNFPNSNFDTDVVPPGHVLAFGDNRRNSKDSRIIGFVDDKEIVGRADVIFWPLDKLAFVKQG